MDIKDATFLTTKDEELLWPLVKELPPDYQLPAFGSNEVIGGEDIKIEHPEIISVIPSGTVLKAETLIQVSYAPRRLETMNFATYLRNLGSHYIEYERLTAQEPDMSFGEMMVKLHKIGIKERHEAYRRLERKFGKEGSKAEQNQAVSRHEHSLLVCKAINDLGIPGIQAEQAPKEDYLDEIDEYLILDPIAMETNGTESGTPIYIGIQRSFENKLDEVRRNPVKYIAEKAGQGAIFRFFLPDEDENYQDIYEKLVNRRDALLEKEAKQQGMTIVEYIEQSARRKGLSEKKFMQSKLQSIPITKYLPHGEQQQIAWAKQILGEAEEQFIKLKGNQTERRLLDRLNSCLRVVMQAKSLVIDEQLDLAV
ncbi:MAG: hypothetical protein V1846_03335 [Candidatus Komeilibacteria bacterium]